jgi:hypothetical protein
MYTISSIDFYKKNSLQKFCTVIMHQVHYFWGLPFTEVSHQSPRDQCRWYTRPAYPYSISLTYAVTAFYHEVSRGWICGWLQVVPWQLNLKSCFLHRGPTTDLTIWNIKIWLQVEDKLISKAPLRLALHTARIICFVRRLRTRNRFVQ